MLNNNEFNLWLEKLIKTSIHFADKIDEDIIIRRYAEYRVKKSNYSLLSKIGKERIKTIINTCFLYCYQNKENWHIIIEGIITWPEICGNEIAINQNNKYYLLKIGYASVFISEDKNECETSYNDFMQSYQIITTPQNL